MSKNEKAGIFRLTGNARVHFREKNDFCWFARKSPEKIKEKEQ